MIGQERLKSTFEQLIEINEFPHFIMIAGAKGQGKKTLAQFISTLKKSVVYQSADLKVDAIRELIADSHALTTDRIYLLADADDMTNQAQNALLKFAEEPSDKAYIIMTVEHLDNVLSTIKSRASVFHMDLYKREHLEQVTSDEFLLKLCSNIGDIERMQSIDVSTMLKTAEKVADNISALNNANTFNIMKHFNLEDCDLFLKLLLYAYEMKLYSTTPMREKVKLVNQVRVIHKYKLQLKNKSINKQNALEMMFLHMREVAS